MNTKKNAGYAGSTPAEKQARGLRTEAARQQQQAVARGIPVIVDITAAPLYLIEPLEGFGRCSYTGTSNDFWAISNQQA